MTVDEQADAYDALLKRIYAVGAETNWNWNNLTLIELSHELDVLLAGMSNISLAEVIRRHRFSWGY